jgi:GAF domain-containing protein
VRLFNETPKPRAADGDRGDPAVISSLPTDIRPALDGAASAARLCGARDAIIQLREGDQLRFAAHHGKLPNMPVGATRQVSRETVSGRAILEGRQIHVHDLPAETAEFPQGSAFARQYGYRTILATPLMKEGAAIGSVMVRRAKAQPFSESHLALVRTFADQAVIAIENVRCSTRRARRSSARRPPQRFSG